MDRHWEGIIDFIDHMNEAEAEWNRKSPYSLNPPEMAQVYDFIALIKRAQYEGDK